MGRIYFMCEPTGVGALETFYRKKMLQKQNKYYLVYNKYNEFNLLIILQKP